MAGWPCFPCFSSFRSKFSRTEASTDVHGCDFGLECSQEGDDKSINATLGYIEPSFSKRGAVFQEQVRQQHLMFYNKQIIRSAAVAQSEQMSQLLCGGPKVSNCEEFKSARPSCRDVFEETLNESTLEYNDTLSTRTSSICTLQGLSRSHSPEIACTHSLTDIVNKSQMPRAESDSDFIPDKMRLQIPSADLFFDNSALQSCNTTIVHQSPCESRAGSADDCPSKVLDHQGSAREIILDKASESQQTQSTKPVHAEQTTNQSSHDHLHPEGNKTEDLNCRPATRSSSALEDQTGSNGARRYIWRMVCETAPVPRRARGQPLSYPSIGMSTRWPPSSTARELTPQISGAHPEACREPNPYAFAALSPPAALARVGRQPSLMQRIEEDMWVLDQEGGGEDDQGEEGSCIGGAGEAGSCIRGAGQEGSCIRGAVDRSVRQHGGANFMTALLHFGTEDPRHGLLL